MVRAHLPACPSPQGFRVKEGDRVGAMALNHHRHLENIFATVGTGAISHPINIRLSLDHIGYVITHAEDCVIFVDEILLPLVELLYDRIKPAVKNLSICPISRACPRPRSSL